MRDQVALTPLLVLALACSALLGPPPEEQISSALADLAAGGFSFEADVRFRANRYGACDGVACADLALIRERRTILLAPDAFDSPAWLRASLLEIWERYRRPRPGSVPDLARGTLRVMRDGPRVGVDDPQLLRLAHRSYRRLYASLPPEKRADLPDPAGLPFP